MRRLHATPLWLLLCLTQAASAAMTEEEMFFKGTAQVNEGELRFLPHAPETPVHHHRNRIVISESSLSDGWVRLEQCHSHLDAVPSAQITYGAERIRGLRILRAEGIGQAWVEGPSVQLKDIAPGATICIEAQSRALERLGEDGYVLQNGPYMRRFLDGYYPMRVSQTVRLQVPGLAFRTIEPAPQPGFTLEVAADTISYEALFEGRLITRIRFAR